MVRSPSCSASGPGDAARSVDGRSAGPPPRQAAAVQQQKLPRLWFESEAEAYRTDGPPAPWRGVVDRDLCVATGITRDECNETFTTAANPSADVMIQVIRAKTAHWLLMDPDFHLEAALLEP